MKKIFLLSTLYFLLATFISCSPAVERSSTAPAIKDSQLVSLSISPSSAELTIGEEKKFTVSAKDKQGGIVSVIPKWSVQGNIGRISKQGLFKAIAAGEGTIKAFTNSLIANGLVIVKEKKEFEPFFVYTEYTSKDDHFIPSGWMGDNTPEDIIFNDDWRENPHSGETCIKITYTAKATKGNKWSGIYWQEPADNWGKMNAGFDLTGATKLIFWARGEKGGEKIVEFKLGGIRNKYSDSAVAGIGPVILTADWKKYEIDLTDKDMSYIIGGFCWATNLTSNPDGCTFYLDDIKYE